MTTPIYTTKEELDQLLDSEKLVDTGYTPQTPENTTNLISVCRKIISVKEVRSPQDIIDNLRKVIENLPQRMSNHEKIKTAKIYVHREVEKYKSKFSGQEINITPEQNTQFQEQFREIIYSEFGGWIEPKSAAGVYK